MVASGFNLNWLDISKGTIGINEKRLRPLDADVYPNPVDGNKFIIAFKSYCAGEITIQLTDLSRKIIFMDKIDNVIGTEIEFSLGNINSF